MPAHGGSAPGGPGGSALGGCLVETHLPGMATAVGSTHPTGMHSCYTVIWSLK